MQIKQWEDKNLAQYSYGILSDCEKKIILIDPSRNPKPYLDYAKAHNAAITGIIETHPHADFVSSHLELHQITGAVIYTHSLVGAAYPHTGFDEGNSIEMGKIKLSALHTPGHSPDSITVLLEHDGVQHSVFTGDTLFIGDCGRPDLREGTGNLRGTRRELAKSMYHSLHNKLLTLNDDVLLYPGHGAGTLCGKSLSEASVSSIAKEKQTNWSLRQMTEDEFVQNLLNDQPFIPAYFSYDVEINRNGAAPFGESISAVVFGDAVNNITDAEHLNKTVWVVDARQEKAFKKGHLPLSVNLMEGAKFETWLGSIIKPGEPFYLAGENKDQLQRLVERTAAIGYETQIKEVFVLAGAEKKEEPVDLKIFKENLKEYTIVDVRNVSEIKEGKLFENSISIPLPELRNRVFEIPTGKPIVVHCAGGYRSAAASSIIGSILNHQVKVFDLGEAIKEFQ